MMSSWLIELLQLLILKGSVISHIFQKVVFWKIIPFRLACSLVL
uniref:Uncharacterized protein n=1 Tax=Arundo donax TaxID=35708 RepID=A0A0A9ES95_ARUDO